MGCGFQVHFSDIKLVSQDPYPTLGLTIYTYHDQNHDMSVVYGHKNGVIEYSLGTSLLCCKSSKIKMLWFEKVLINSTVFSGNTCFVQSDPADMFF